MDHQAKKDDILYMDEMNGDPTRPLTMDQDEPKVHIRPRADSVSEIDTVDSLESQPMFIPSIGARLGSGSLLETDNTNNPRPTTGPEMDDLGPENVQPGLNNNKGIDDGLLPERPPTRPTSPFPERRPSFAPPLDPSFPDSRPSFFPSLDPPVSTPDVNVYQHKKTLAQGMMDLALLSANANQLRYVLQTDGQHPYFYPSLVMIGMSLFLQIAVGIGLIWNSRYNVKDHAQMCKANKANNLTVIGIFLVTTLNVFISSFGVVDQTTAVQAVQAVQAVTT